MKSRKFSEKGSAAVEFCITLPLYLVIFHGVLFFGQATFVNQEMSLARAYATFSPNQDSDGYLNANVLSGYMGVLNVQAHGTRNAPVAGGDLDSDGTPDKYVDIQRVSLQGTDGQSEIWSNHGKSSSQLATDYQMNTGPFSNFDQNYSQATPTPNQNRVWMNWPVTVLEYDYSPDFARFVSNVKLDTRQYLSYDIPAETPDPNAKKCRGCHSSVVQEGNYRRTARDYRGMQGGSLPTAGSEANLWNQLKVRDMEELIRVSASILASSPPVVDSSTGNSDLADPTPIPSADEIDPNGQGLVRRIEWDTSEVINYEQQTP